MSLQFQIKELSSLARLQFLNLRIVLHINGLFAIVTRFPEWKPAVISSDQSNSGRDTAAMPVIVPAAYITTLNTLPIDTNTRKALTDRNTTKVRTFPSSDGLVEFRNPDREIFFVKEMLTNIKPSVNIWLCLQ